MARTDGALYQAKRGGRDRAVLADPGEVARADRKGWVIVPTSPGEGPGPPAPGTVVLTPLARLVGLGDGEGWVDPYDRIAYERAPSLEEGNASPPVSGPAPRTAPGTKPDG